MSLILLRLAIAICTATFVNSEASRQGSSIDDRLATIRSIEAEFTQPANVPSIEGEFDYTGKLNLSKSMGSVSSFDRSLEFFKSEELQKEIELVESQKKRFDQQILAWENALEKLIDKFHFERKSGNVPQAQEVAGDIIELNLVSEGNVEDILVDHQYVWMKQIQVRYLVRTNGLRGAMRIDRVRQFADISDGELKQLAALKKECIEHLAKRSEEIIESSIEDLFGDFSKEQILIISKRFPEFENGTVQNMEQLRAHILMVEEYESNEELVSLYEQLAKFPIFRLSISGGLEPVYLDVKFYDGEQNVMKARLLESALSASKSLGKSLRLSDDQVLKCGMVLKTMKSEYRKLSREGMNPTANSSESLKVAKERLRRRRHRVAEETLSRIKEVAGEQTLSAIDEIAESVLMRRRGPLVDILHGKLGEQLKLTAKQEQDFRKRISSVAEFLNKQAIEIESDIIEKQLDCFDAGSRSKIESLLGPKLKNSSPSLIGIRIGL